MTISEVRPRNATMSMRRLTAATVVGNTIEFYDFNVYGTLTAVVFGSLFFSADNPTVGVLLAFATFAIGFLARPIGGVVFGHFGDKYGRKKVLVASLLTMGLATTCMGLLPTHAQVGVVAPIALVVLRFIQGFAIGGEWGGAVTLMMESAPKKRRGLFGAAVQTGAGLGIILATAMISGLFFLLSMDQIMAWGWRIPLLFSVVLVVIGLIIRSRISESPVFESEKKADDTPRTPVLETLRFHWRMVLLAIGMYVGVAAFGFTQGVFFTSYLVNTVHFAPGVASLANLIAAVGYLLATIAGGWLADKLTRTKAYVIGGVLIIGATLLMFALGATGSQPVILVGMFFVGAMSGIAYGAQASLFFELFPARVRYTGVSLGFQIAAVLGGGLTPLIAASLTQATGSTVAIAVYISVLALVMIGCTLASPWVLRLENRSTPTTASGG